MYTAFFQHDNTFSLSDTNNPTHWLDITNPTDEELVFLHEKYGIPLSYLQAPLDKNELPRFEHEGQICLILVRASYSCPKSKLPFDTAPIAIILTPEVVITFSTRSGIVQKLMAPKMKIVDARPAILVALHLLKRISVHYIDHLRRMDTLTEDIELALRKSMQNQELLSMLHLEKSLIYFLTALRSNLSVIEQLNDSADDFSLTTKERLILKSAIIENKQATDMADIFTAILGSYSDTFGSIVSNNLNKVMKFLTGITIVLMVPTILGSYYGMNVPLPFQDHPSAFPAIMAASVFFSGAVWLFFWRKNWI